MARSAHLAEGPGGGRGAYSITALALPRSTPNRWQVTSEFTVTFASTHYFPQGCTLHFVGGSSGLRGQGRTSWRDLARGRHLASPRVHGARTACLYQGAYIWSPQREQGKGLLWLFLVLTFSGLFQVQRQLEEIGVTAVISDNVPAMLRANKLRTPPSVGANSATAR